MTPSFNAEATLEATYESLRRQTFDEWGWSVVDDGSTDGTCEILDRICAADPRCRWRPRAHGPKGGSTCRNQALAARDSEFVVFLDADDLLAPTCLAERVSFMERHPEADFGVFPMQDFATRVGDSNRVLAIRPGDQRVDPIARFLRFEFPWTITSPIWRRGALPPGPFTETYTRLQDPEMHLRALFAGTSYVLCDSSHPPDCYRRVPPSMTTERRNQKTRGMTSNYLQWLAMCLSEVRAIPDARRRKGYLGDLRYNVANFVREEAIQRDSMEGADAVVDQLVDDGLLTGLHRHLFRAAFVLKRAGVRSRLLHRALLFPVEAGFGAAG